MSQISKSMGKVPEYDVRNPKVDLSSWKRMIKLTKQSYSTFPLFIINLGVVPVAFAYYVVYRVTNTPDLFRFYPGHQPQWDKWEHKHGKLSKIPEKDLMAEHPRPRYEYKMPSQKLNFGCFLCRIFFAQNKKD